MIRTLKTIQELLNELPAALHTISQMAQQFATLVERVEKLESALTQQAGAKGGAQ